MQSASIVVSVQIYRTGGEAAPWPQAAEHNRMAQGGKRRHQIDGEKLQWR
jgi:hypothetical protein